MKTYMILVNGRYMVKVNLETESLGGAEHYILDNFPGCEQALAFDEKTIATKWFVRDYLAPNELISMAELERMSKYYEAACLELSDADDAKAAKLREVEEAKAVLAKLEAEAHELQKQVVSARTNRENARQELGVA